ncbi:C13 family peptidase [Desulfococcaceae bacterium HSG8]|nr:C13 family peptidase [Desulfococcaceae bacterium HSG8]
MSLTGTGFDENTGVSIYLARIIGSVDTPGYARGVIVSDGKAYVADRDGGLQIIDIGNPENPVIIGSVETPGSAYGVTVSDGKAYVADDGGLQVIDIGDPENPVIIGSVQTPGYALGVTVSDGKAYVACGGYEQWDGLQVIDIGDPENPVIIGSVETPGSARGVTVSDGKAYVADGNGGLQVIDIGDPENPVIIGSVETPGDTYDVAISDGKAYVADRDGGLQVIDIANPENPVIIGSVETPGYAKDITISDGKAYVADDDGGLQVIDIANPENPVIIVSVETPGSVQGVTVSDGKAYVADESYGLSVLPLPVEIWSVTVNSETDISLTLPGPRIPGRYTLGVFNENESYELPDAIAFAPDWNPESGKLSMELHGGIWIDGARAEGEGYTVAAFGPGGDSDCRGKADITDSEGEWNYRLSITADGNGEKITFKIWDNNTGQIHSIGDTIIFEADSYVNKNLDIPLTLESVSPDQGIAGQVLEVTLTGARFDENTEVIIYPDIGSVETPEDAWGVTVSDGKAYLACSGYGDEKQWSGLSVIDISNPGNPVIIGSVETPTAAYDVAVSNGRVYLTSRLNNYWYDGGRLHVIDIGNPENPVIIGSVEIPGALFVSTSDGKAYVTDGDDLHVIDIGNPENPVIIGSVETPGEALGVTVSDGKAYVADWDGGLQVIDIGNPENPVIIGSVETPGSARGVSVSDGKAYVACAEYYEEWSDLQVIDIGNPENPVIIGSVEIPGEAWLVSTSDGKAYVTDGDGLQVIDIGDPGNPVIIGSVEIPGEAWLVTISDGKAYVTGNYGLSVVTLSVETGPFTVNSETDISLTLPDSLVPGRYTLRVSNENESDELPGAIAFAPDWNPESGKFTMELNGGIWIDGVRAEGDGYTVAAFGPGGDSDCRGKADIFNSEEEWSYRLTVTADDNGEKIAFKIWDSNTGQIRSIGDAIVFKADSYVNKNLDISLKLKSVYPNLGVATRDIDADVVLTGTGFDENTRVSMYLDTGNKRMIIGSVEFPDYDFDSVIRSDVTVSDGKAYVADGHYGLHVIDASNPENPVIIGSVETPGRAYSVAVSDEKAYVADGEEGLQVIDIGNPENLVIIGSADTPGIAVDVTVSDEKAYVVDGALQIIDISNPENLIIIGSVVTPGMASGVAVSDGKAYVVSDSLQVIDIGNPENPVIIGAVEFPRYAFNYGDANDVTVSGEKVYVADAYYGFHVIDVSNPKNPVIIGSVGAFGTSSVSSVAVSDGKAYVASDGLQVIDIDNPENPVIIGSIETPGDVFGVTVSDGKTYVVYHTHGRSGLQVIGIGNPEKNYATIWPRFADGWGDIISNDVMVSDGKAYVISCDDYIIEYMPECDRCALQVIDISNPQNPVIIGLVWTSSWARGVTVSDGKAYVVCRPYDTEFWSYGEWSGLQVIDIGNPENPVITGSIEIPEIYDVTVSDGKAYVVCRPYDTDLWNNGENGEWSGLQVIDIGNPENPIITGSIEIPEIYDVTVSDGKAYVVCSLNEEWSSLLQVIDIGNPENPVIIGSVETPGYASNVIVSAGKAYVPDGNGRFHMIDIANPENPVIIGSADAPDSAEDDVSEDGIVCRLNEDGRISVVSMPVEISSVTVNNETDISLTLPGPRIPGHYTLKVFNENESHELHGAVTFATPEDSYLLDTKAIILAGGGSDPGNKIWEETRMAAEHAYEALLYQGYTAESIYYLSPETDSERVDAPPTHDNLSYAINDWIKEEPYATQLLLYLVDHGTDGRFKINAEEVLSAEELDNWLDNLQTVSPVPVLFVYDACESGTFLPYLRPPSDAERITIASASAGESAYFIGRGTLSFSYQFWDAVYNGKNADEAFLQAKNQMSPYQTALIDTNGNGVGNEPEDQNLTNEARRIRRGYRPPLDVPYIYDISSEPEFLYSGETTATLRAAVSYSEDKSEIRRVWAVIEPPGFDPGSPDTPVTDLPEVELTDPDRDGFYEGIYDSFTARGTYSITFCAVSKKGVYSTFRTITTEKERDYITGVSEDQSLDEETFATIQAHVNSETGITRVWAEIIPPDSDPDSPTILTEKLHDPDNDGTYEALYNGFTQDGTYLITVYAEDAGGSVSLPAQTSVTRTGTSEHADEYEGDDTFLQAGIIRINGAAPQYHTFHDGGDEDWTKFYAISGQTYQIRVSNLSDTCDAVAEIYDTDGIILAKTENTGTAGTEAVLDWECQHTGPFFVKLGNLNPGFFGENTGYALELYQPVGDFRGELTGTVTDAESGEPLGEAVVITDDGFSDLTYPDGTYRIIRRPGSFTMTVQAPGYVPMARPVIMEEDEAVTEDFELEPYEAPEWVRLSGTVLDDEGIPLCAIVLANGQHTFSCDGDGRYDLEAPRDENGEITMYAFCDGLAPFGEILAPEEAADIDITMQPAAPNSRYMTLTADTEPAESGLVRISGTVTDEDGTPLCAMVLANGQHTFSCEGDGRYDLEVPQDENGEITLFGFCDGVQPFKQILKP